MPNSESKKQKKKVKHIPRDKSTSGKYKSVRHLMEILFKKNKSITNEQAKKIVKKEYPNSKYLKSNTTHFPWYRTHIAHRGEFKTIEPPEWALKINVK